MSGKPVKAILRYFQNREIEIAGSTKIVFKIIDFIDKNSAYDKFESNIINAGQKFIYFLFIFIIICSGSCVLLSKHLRQEESSNTPIFF